MGVREGRGHPLWSDEEEGGAALPELGNPSFPPGTALLWGKPGLPPATTNPCLVRLAGPPVCAPHLSPQLLQLPTGLQPRLLRLPEAATHACGLLAGSCPGLLQD